MEQVASIPVEGYFIRRSVPTERTKFRGDTFSATPNSSDTAAGEKALPLIGAITRMRPDDEHDPR
jgi:hypothetical protein